MRFQRILLEGIFAVLTTASIAVSFSGCASNTSRLDFENDCEYAKAYHAEMQESVRLYYALGQTSVAEIAIAERRLKKAKEGYEAACGEKALGDAL